MRQLKPKRFATSVAPVAGTTAAAAMIALGIGIAAAVPPDQPDPNGATRVEFGTTVRDCDFNPVGAPGTAKGTGFAIIGTTFNTVLADVHLTNAAPNTTYKVRLIELPSSTCGPSAAGVAGETIHTNQAGDDTVRLQTDLVPGATGAWVMVFDDVSGQLYTTNTVAPISSAGGH